MTDAPASDRSGAVLPTVVLVLLASTLLMHAGWWIVIHQERVARVGVAWLRASAAADAGLHAAEQAWRGPEDSVSVDPPASGSVAWEEGARVRWRIEPLAPELRLLVGEGEAEGLARPVRHGRLVWTLDPLTRVRSAEAVVVEGEPGSAAVDPGGWTDGEACGMPPTWTPVPARHTGDPVVPFGWLDADALGRGARVVSGPSIVLDPGPGDEPCAVDRPSNWGAPGAPEHPCHFHQVHRRARGSLSLLGGVGQGVLVVEGDLRIGGGARFEGLVVTEGRVVVEEDGRLHGHVRAGGGVVTSSGGRIVGSGCALFESLRSATGLRLPIRLPGRGWLALF